jgi:hypothetical protein
MVIVIGILLITLVDQNQSAADPPPATKPTADKPASVADKSTKPAAADKPETEKHRKWKTGIFNKAHPLQGPFVVTFLRTSVDPASPKKQFVLFGSDWFSPEEFTGELYLGAGQQLITRSDFSPRDVIYSGYEP